MNNILENMYSIDNSLYIILRKHENINISLKINNLKIPEILEYYNNFRYTETDKIDLIEIDKWNLVKKEIRYYENSLNRKLMEYKINIDKYTPVSRAWIKFYEILSKTKIYDNIDNTIIRAFHICEAPGTFIHSTLFYLKNKKIYDWNALKIDPNITQIGDIYKLIKNNRDKWSFNDITKREAIIYYKDICLNKQFIIGDCGIVYEEDESNAIKLYYSQMLFILHNLQNNGYCIFKQILNFKYKIIIDMLYIIFYSFDKIEFYKSTQNNFSSEFYIICYNYNNIISDYTILLNLLDEDLLNVSIINTYSDDFLYQFSNAYNKLLNIFNEAIKRQLYYTNNWDTISSEHKKEIKKMIDEKNNDWIFLFYEKNI